MRRASSPVGMQARCELAVTITISYTSRSLSCKPIKGRHGREREMARSCSKPGCQEPHTARGFCHRHYREFLRGGADRIANPTRHYGLTDEVRFWLYVQKGP